ncbi:gamma-type small acid-soluble spore protein [Sporosarcina sp. USHLN248]|uniref:gamma-type small acid-soluble spore protein n=1 Tax=Sporosarcina sp. USHLN248 TaxID=3081300 RepID=UPI00301765FF
MKDSKKFTEAGTDIEKVKRQNAQSGLSYYEVKELIARTGGRGTAMYSDTDPEQIKKNIKGNE